MQTMIDDATLVAEAAGGSTVAFDELHRAHAPAAWAYAVAVSGDATIAAESVADAFGLVFTAFTAGRLPTTVSFRRYLLMATRNAFTDRLSTATGARTDRAGDPVIAAAFARMPERWQSVLWLRLVEGLPLGDTAATVKLAGGEVVTLADRAARGMAQQYLNLHLRQNPGLACERAVPRLLAFAGGRLDAADAGALATHVAVCAPCAHRYATLADLDYRLAAMAIAMPDSVHGASTATWTAATTPAPTGTGLSPRAERTLAIVSAAAAAATVFATAAFQFRGNPSGDSAALGPIVSQVASPIGLELPIGIRLDGLPTDGTAAATPTAPEGDAFGAGARRVADGTNGRTGAIGDSATDPLGAIPTPGGAGVVPLTPAPSEPVTPTNPNGPRVPSVPSVPDAPTVGVGTTVADVPVAAEVGSKNGLTLGPVSVGSSPQPDGGLIQVEGPLEVLDPVVAPVNGLVGGLLG